MKRRRWLGGGVLGGLILGISAILSRAIPAAEQASPEDGKLRIIAFGAHPDDCEIFAGGTACLWAEQGQHVKFVSATNGDIGHWQMAGGPLAQRRLQEVQAVAKILGNTVQVLDIHDGEIEPTLENRRTFTRLIRNWNADIVITHRPNDYHPDHRYTGILVQDSAYMVTVPFFCPDTPALKKNPVFLYASDGFQKPNPFKPDVVVSIDSVIERKLDALAELVSQFIEGGCGGGPGSMPRDEADLKARQAQLKQGWFRQRHVQIANSYRDKLIELYGEEAGKQVEYAEAFEVCEYGPRPTPNDLRKLFPVSPQKP
jgi:LmbE family N-acetylglucosaminyl deacetylase